METFRRVLLPLLFPAVVSAFLIAFTLSFDEYAIASFVVGSDAIYPIYLFSQLRVAFLFPQLLAVSSIVLVVSLLLVLAMELGRRRSGRKLEGEPGGIVL
jgi:spermidine/putrescine transport system permease protein